VAAEKGGTAVMTNDKFRMTNEAPMTKREWEWPAANRTLPATPDFVIRHSSFVIFQP
jgi:hypothetical protein